MFGNSCPSRNLSGELLEDRDYRYRILNQVNAQEGVLKTRAAGDFDYAILFWMVHRERK